MAARPQHVGSESPHLLQFGPFTLDTANRQLRQGEAAIALEAKPLSLLILFAEHPGELLRKADILERVWQGQQRNEAVLTTAISKLRDTLAAGCVQAIRTVHGHGYRFEAEVRTVAALPCGPPNSAPAIGLAEIDLRAWLQTQATWAALPAPARDTVELRLRDALADALSSARAEPAPHAMTAPSVAMERTIARDAPASALAQGHTAPTPVAGITATPAAAAAPRPSPRHEPTTRGRWMWGLVALLLGVIAFGGWKWRQSVLHSQLSAAQTAAINAFLTQDVLGASNVHQTQGDPSQRTVRDALDNAAATLERRSLTADVRDEIALAIAASYQSLAAWDKAAALLAQRVAIAQKTRARGDPLRLRLETNYAEALGDLDQLGSAERLFADVVQAARGASDPQAQRSYQRARCAAARMALAQGRLQRAITLAQATLDDANGWRDGYRRAADAAWTVAEAAWLRQDPEAAAPAFEDAIARFAVTDGREGYLPLWVRISRAGWVASTGNTAEAIAELDHIITRASGILGPMHHVPLKARSLRAQLTCKLGDRSCLAELAAVQDAYRRTMGAQHGHTLLTGLRLAAGSALMGDAAHAAPKATTAREALERRLGASNPQTLYARHVECLSLARAASPDSPRCALVQKAALDASEVGAAHPWRLANQALLLASVQTDRRAAGIAATQQSLASARGLDPQLRAALEGWLANQAATAKDIPTALWRLLW